MMSGVCTVCPFLLLSSDPCMDGPQTVQPFPAAGHVGFSSLGLLEIKFLGNICVEVLSWCLFISLE